MNNKQNAADGKASSNNDNKQWNAGLIGHVEVELSAFVGTATISVEKLFSLQKGDVVSLNESVDEPLVLMLNGQPFARGELVAVEDSFGVRITELK